jgi:hypothetical protein
VVAVQGELHRVVEQVHDLHAVGRSRLEVDGEGQVEPAVPQPGHALLRRGLADAEPHRGMALAEDVDRRRQHRGGGGGEGGQPQMPGAQVGEVGERRLAASTWARMTSACSTSVRPASVRTTPRARRSTSAAPASRSSAATCWETADGEYDSASAAPASEPERATSRRTRSRPRFSTLRP